MKVLGTVIICLKTQDELAEDSVVRNLRTTAEALVAFQHKVGNIKVLKNTLFYFEESVLKDTF